MIYFYPAIFVEGGNGYESIRRHYKGNDYEVLGLATHSETLEPMVVYRALYGEYGLWVRPAKMWNELVEVSGQQVPRFRYEGEE